jgi:hypothetical protein
MVHKGKKDTADWELGTFVAEEMAEANNLPLFFGSRAGYPGVADWTNLGVLSGAEDVETDRGYQASILAECYFMDDPKLDPLTFDKMSRNAGVGIAKGCVRYLKAKN